MTAEAGRLGAPRLLAIGDATAGLVVRLPAGASGFRRGTIIRVSGTLAAPYGQLEIRPASSSVSSLGTSVLPAAVPVAAEGLSETTEARLVTVAGKLVDKPKKTSGGDVTIILERDGEAPVKVSADASSGVKPDSFKVGTTYRVVGVAGQRATHAGALDGYRIWIRDADDVVVVAAAAPKPNPSHGPGSPKPSASTSVTVTIAAARRINDRAVEIDATVTAPATLLDATGRRIVVQDGSGAIEVGLPAGVAAPPVGSRVRVEGRIGVAYGAPRLKADTLEVRGTGKAPAPLILHGPAGDAHEWRLVTVSGQVEKVHKLGDRWRAEVRVGSQLVPVVGQPGSGIAVTTLAEGGMATVTGIVRRPYPTATDRRFSIIPRFPADLNMGRGAPKSDARAVGASAVGGSTAGTSVASSPATGAPDPAPPAGAVDADLADLASFAGVLVRVGGLVVSLEPGGFTLDDGTSVGRVLVTGEAAVQLALIEPDDALNAIGHVKVTDDGVVVVVDAPGGISFAGDPVAAAALAAVDATPSPSASPEQSAEAGSGGPVSQLASLSAAPWPLDAGVAGGGALLLAALLSVAVTVARREHSRRRLSHRVAARLASVAGPVPPPAPVSVAKRGPSTPGSA